MAWKATGEDRVRGYRVYRELEERYRDLESENVRLKALLEVRDATIRTLASEIATGTGALTREAVDATIAAVERLSDLSSLALRSIPDAPPEPPRRPESYIRRGVPLSEQFPERPKAKE